MPKYLRTSGISASIDELIREAKERLYIISPYLKLSDNVKELFNDKEREKVEIRIIFGKQELSPSELEFLEGLRYVRLYYSKNLHAKCYLNEIKMIITSMNLYEFSQQNNREMGILIDRGSEADKKVYDEAWLDIESILNNADDFSYKKAPKQQQIDDKVSTLGYCIISGIEIPFNPEKPMSYECFKVWSQYSDPDYPEKYCHFSGEPSHGETSVSRPILRKNWNRAKSHLKGV